MELENHLEKHSPRSNKHAVMHLIKKRKGKTVVCVTLVLGLGSGQPASRSPWRFRLDYFKSTFAEPSK